MNNASTIIELNNVQFSFALEEVIKNINLQINKGDYLAIVGPNGAGKTSLLKCILGLLKPQKGTIKLFNQELSTFKEWYRLGYVPQKVNFDLNFPSTAREVVAMGLYGKKGLFKEITKEDWEDIDKALMQVGMYKLAYKRIGDLSGGQQQRIFIARALVSRPEVIFLDEPTVGVDTETRNQFFALLEMLNKKLALTLVLITHDMDIVLHHGVLQVAYINSEILFNGTPKDFLKTKYIDEHYRKHV